MPDKMLHSLKEALQRCEVKDGMTLSFHHHLRNGDHVLNMVMDAAAELGMRDLKVAASSLFPVHAPLVEHMKNGVVSRLDTDYMSGPVAEAVLDGVLAEPVLFHSHGGRARAIDAGDLQVDVAFIAAPTADRMGNINGVEGPSACGSLGYAMPDSRHARQVVAVSDNVCDATLQTVSISQDFVDFVVPLPKIGDAAGIVSGTTKMTRDPVAMRMARTAAQVIECSGLLRDGFNFQTGAGGASLATALFLRDIMRREKLHGGFLLGGITKYMVDMLEEDLFEAIQDVQCFDLPAVASIGRNSRHHEISASLYASPDSKSAFVDWLDVVLLGATEIDLNFNVNVHTDSNGRIIGGSGGHCDAAKGAKLAIIVAPLVRGRLPIVTERVTTITTPGDSVDMLITEHGVAVNPANAALRQRLAGTGLPLRDIGELRELAIRMAGTPRAVKPMGKVVADVEYRDGTIIDHIRQLTPSA